MKKTEEEIVSFSHDPSWPLVCETLPQLNQQNMSWTTWGSLWHRWWPERGLGLLISHVSMSWLTSEIRQTFHVCVKFSFIYWANNQNSYRKANVNKKLKYWYMTNTLSLHCNAESSLFYSLPFEKHTHTHTTICFMSHLKPWAKCFSISASLH